jgi:hypothetical protein
MKNCKKLFWIILFFGLLAFVGCEGDETTGPGDDEMTVENYFPLAVGNWWQYDLDPDASDTATVLIRLTEDEIWNERRIYKVDFRYTFFKWLTYYDEEVRGYYSYPSDTTTFIVCLKEPIEEGNKWGERYSIALEWIDTLEITRVGHTIYTQAGLFENCVEISHKEDTNYFPVFDFAPGVGIVREHYQHAWFTGSLESELFDYNIQK